MGKTEIGNLPPGYAAELLKHAYNDELKTIRTPYSRYAVDYVLKAHRSISCK